MRETSLGNQDTRQSDAGRLCEMTLIDPQRAFEPQSATSEAGFSVHHRLRVKSFI